MRVGRSDLAETVKERKRGGGGGGGDDSWRVSTVGAA